MSTVIHPDPKQLLAMAAHTVEPVTEVRAESRDAMVKRIATARLKSMLTDVAPIDIINGLHAVIGPKHGAALRAAWLESPEAFGDLLMSICVREMEIQAEIDAQQIVERMRGAELSRTPRVFRIVGDV